ncbi:hypothetical protein phiPsa267_054 [Pseudomonas phage phiPsa267]|uniref:Uncharacterized protein n=2 Tax=Otagovirus TaxID=2560197 RepID=A0A7G9V152_9CAUD|nr:hypothetical protein QGX19_gp176 [Pseudomonas phage phiPsa267]YP_010767838.1 hypothetical protein QGX20_gp170 [Pseudomonas phage phiPsa300]QNO00008.1 hypothetical protein phiPsa267_054 [Pseudomonas phage phiPsa267]QNO00182.1 hypothetical protein phiPsa300_052 [Pseudomonas phage phiPsa300]
MTVREDVNAILDIFGGADGGVGFARMIFILDDYEKQALEGCPSAIQLIEVVSRFRRLVDLTSK